jgi:hypothetical protein
VTKSQKVRGRSSGANSAQKYSPERLKEDLDRVCTVYTSLGRSRNAIYEYLTEVYKLRRKWRRLQQNMSMKIKQIAHHAVGRRVPHISGDDLLRFIIDETIPMDVNPPTARTRLSKAKFKYFALLNYAYAQGVSTPALLDFITKHGGINFTK